MILRTGRRAAALFLCVLTDCSSPASDPDALLARSGYAERWR
jgi:hypothetical protein